MTDTHTIYRTLGVLRHVLISHVVYIVVGHLLYRIMRSSMTRPTDVYSACVTVVRSEDLARSTHGAARRLQDCPVVTRKRHLQHEFCP